MSSIPSVLGVKRDIYVDVKCSDCVTVRELELAKRNINSNISLQLGVNELKKSSLKKPFAVNTL